MVSKSDQLLIVVSILEGERAPGQERLALGREAEGVTAGVEQNWEEQSKNPDSQGRDRAAHGGVGRCRSIAGGGLWRRRRIGGIRQGLLEEMQVQTEARLTLQWSPSK